MRSLRPPRATYTGVGDVGGSGAGIARVSSGVEAGTCCWKMEVAKLNVKALLPVEGAWFSEAFAVVVGTLGVPPFCGVEVGNVK